MGYRTIDIANYVIWYLRVNHDKQINPQTLQKIVAMIYDVLQGDINIFQENCKKRIRNSIYHNFKSYGFDYVTNTAIKYTLTDKGYIKECFEYSIIGKEHRDLIDQIIDDYLMA